MLASSASLHQESTEAQPQLPTGPRGLPKQRPAIAQLREAMTALHVMGACRAVSYELLSYWSPGGDVFPSVQTLSDGLGMKPRMLQYHLSHLSRVGLWVRVRRPGRTNLYELHLPGDAQDAFTSTTEGVQSVAPPPCNGLHPKWSVKGKRGLRGRSANPYPIGAIRTPKTGRSAPPPEAVAAPPSVDDVMKFTAPAGGEPGPNQRAFMGQLKALSKAPRKMTGPLPTEIDLFPRGGCAHERIMGGFCETCGLDVRDYGADFNYGH